MCRAGHRLSIRNRNICQADRCCKRCAPRMDTMHKTNFLQALVSVSLFSISKRVLTVSCSKACAESPPQRLCGLAPARNRHSTIYFESALEHCILESALYRPPHPSLLVSSRTPPSPEHPQFDGWRAVLSFILESLHSYDTALCHGTGRAAHRHAPPTIFSKFPPCP